MIKKLVATVAVAGTLALGVACSSQPVEVTREVLITREVEVTRELPTYTPYPIPTAVVREVEIPVTREVEREVLVEVTREVPVTRQTVKTLEVVEKVPVTRIVTRTVPVTRVVTQIRTEIKTVVATPTPAPRRPPITITGYGEGLLEDEVFYLPSGRYKVTTSWSSHCFSGLKGHFDEMERYRSEWLSDGGCGDVKSKTEVLYQQESRTYTPEAVNTRGWWEVTFTPWP